MTSKKLSSYIEELEAKFVRKYNAYRKARERCVPEDFKESSTIEELAGAKCDLREVVYLVMEMKENGEDIQGYFFY